MPQTWNSLIASTKSVYFAFLIILKQLVLLQTWQSKQFLTLFMVFVTNDNINSEHDEAESENFEVHVSTSPVVCGKCWPQKMAKKLTIWIPITQLVMVVNLQLFLRKIIWINQLYITCSSINVSKSWNIQMALRPCLIIEVTNIVLLYQLFLNN